MSSQDLFREVKQCPWCADGKSFRTLYNIEQGGQARKCEKCGMVYATKVLSNYGLKQYWSDYESEIHMADAALSDKRRQMYKIEYEYIKRYLLKGAGILDVGCSNGDFLDLFSQDGYKCEGVEFGEDAYNQSSKKYKVYFGDLKDLNIESRYDLIIFRGVIQYLLSPKEDLKKAITLLKDEGMIFITSSPNAESLCFNLFLDKFTLPVNTTNYYMFSEKILTKFLTENGMRLFAKEQMYLGTPYENAANDILRVADAIRNRDAGKIVFNESPPFFDNMLTLVYKKYKGLA